MKPSPTLREISAHLGVSIYSVSLALRGSERVAPDTRARILAAAHELGYRPNPTIAALMRSIRSKAGVPHLTTLALVVPLQDPQWNGRHRYMADIAAGVRERCTALGFGYEQFTVMPDQSSGRSLNRVIEARGIDGLMFAPQYESEGFFGLDFSHLAYVAIGLTFKEAPAHRVTTSVVANISCALEHTLALGWSRPGIVQMDRGNDIGENTMLGAYLGYLHRRVERPPAPFIYKEAEFTAENVVSWVRREGVNAVLSSRAIIGRWLQDAGMRVGKDISFALLDRPRQAPGMAGIVQRLDEVGGTSVEVLGELIHTNHRGIPAIPRVVEVYGEWQDGASMPPCPPPTRVRRKRVAD